MRQCGDCTLCCKLLPVRELDKGANTRCRHQRHHKGCSVYGKPDMPISCKLWNCRWIVEDDTADMRRPDRAGYVIDVLPDYIVVRQDDDGSTINVPVIQVWIDPARPELWRDDKELFQFAARRGLEGMATLVRYGSEKATTLLPPNMSDDGQWHVIDNGMGEATHTPEQKMRAGLIDLMEHAAVQSLGRLL